MNRSTAAVMILGCALLSALSYSLGLFVGFYQGYEAGRQHPLSAINHGGGVFEHGWE